MLLPRLACERLWKRHSRPPAYAQPTQAISPLAGNLLCYAVFARDFEAVEPTDGGNVNESLRTSSPWPRAGRCPNRRRCPRSSGSDRGLKEWRESEAPAMTAAGACLCERRSCRDRVYPSLVASRG